MHGPILYLESIGCETRKLYGLERGGPKVLHAAASDAVKVMVAPSAQLEARSTARMRNAAREPELDQRLKHTVHRGPRNTGKSPAHGLEQVIGAWVIEARSQGLKHGAPLYRHRETPFPASLLQSAKSALDLAISALGGTGIHCTCILLPTSTTVKSGADQPTIRPGGWQECARGAQARDAA